MLKAAVQDRFDNVSLIDMFNFRSYLSLDPLIKGFIKAAAREFILRTVSPCPGPSSSSCPHRMFCLLSKDEMRLAAAFSEDILLF